MSSQNGQNDRQKQLASVWEVYKRQPTKELRNELLIAYLPLVKFIAERLAKTLPPFIDVEEIASIGIFGLYDAIDRFDLSVGVKFKTYATNRIRGAILDELRTQDWVPRLVRIKASRMNKARQTLEIRLGREPNIAELAEELGIAPDECTELSEEGTATAIISLSDEWTDQEGEHGNRKIDLLEDRQRDSAPDFPLSKDDVVRVVGEVLGEGSTSYIVILLYYLEEMSLKEIGGLLNLSEGRICQIRGIALSQLKERLLLNSEELI